MSCEPDLKLATARGLGATDLNPNTKTTKRQSEQNLSPSPEVWASVSTIWTNLCIVLNQLGDPYDFNVRRYFIIVRPQVFWRQHLGRFVGQQVPAMKKDIQIHTVSIFLFRYFSLMLCRIVPVEMTLLLPNSFDLVFGILLWHFVTVPGKRAEIKTQILLPNV